MSESSVALDGLEPRWAARARATPGRARSAAVGDAGAHGSRVEGRPRTGNVSDRIVRSGAMGDYTRAPLVVLLEGTANTASVPNDARLVQLARRGDRAAFEALVRRHYRAAYAVAYARTGNGMDAEDVCQDAFVRALERLDECRRPQAFAAWLLIVRTRAHNYRAYQSLRCGTPLDPERTMSADDTAARAERAELGATLAAALGELTELQRGVLLLHDLEGWKHREIAGALDLSEVASRQHLFTARRALRQRLDLRVWVKGHTDDR